MGYFIKMYLFLYLFFGGAMVRMKGGDIFKHPIWFRIGEGGHSKTKKSNPNGFKNV